MFTAGWWRGYGGGNVTSRDTSRWDGLGVFGAEEVMDNNEFRYGRGVSCLASCHPTFSGGYSFSEYLSLGPA